MSFVPSMWVIWAVLVLLFVSLKLYVTRLGRDEDDQLVLDDAFQRVRDEQAIIVAKINKVQPVRRVVLVLLSLMTLVVFAYYVQNMISQFHQ